MPFDKLESNKTEGDKREDTKDDSVKRFTGTVYQKLPPVVTNVISDQFTRELTIDEFLDETLPLSSTLVRKNDLQKVNIALAGDYKRPSKNVEPRKRKNRLSQKERRALGLIRKLPKHGIKFKDAMKMNRLWQQYMEQHLGLDHLDKKARWYDPTNGYSLESTNTLLLKADYHGAIIKVLRSKCYSLINHEGVVVVETKYTFQIVGNDNVTRTIPKEQSIFEVKLKQYKFIIYGKYFCIKSSERSTKKQKNMFIPVL